MSILQPGNNRVIMGYYLNNDVIVIVNDNDNEVIS